MNELWKRFDKEEPEKQPFSIEFYITGSEAGDSVTAAPDSGEAGETITLNYTVANTKKNNLLGFGGAGAPIAGAESAGSGTRAYTVSPGDASADGIITIIAAFLHTDLTPDPIAFADPAPVIAKAYGDAPFTNAITNAHRGTGAISYSSGNAAAATVDNAGTVTIHSPGTAVITAEKAADGVYAHASASYTLTVTAIPASGVTLNANTLTIPLGGTATLTATVQPANAENKAVSWASSAPAVATVSGGTVTAVSEGTATITVSTADGGFTASCEVTVALKQPVPGMNLTQKLQWLKANAETGGTYLVELAADDSQDGTSTNTGDPNYLGYGGKTDITVYLAGTGAARTVSLTANGAHFVVPGGVTLVLGSNITLQGRSSNTLSLVQVNGGSFIMEGGTISDNEAISGGGVYVASRGEFTMSGGEISENEVTAGSPALGGGVCVNGNSSSGGSFTMSGGSISNNTVISGTNNGYHYGGGVYVGYSTFTMSGSAEITGNTAGGGGGVYVTHTNSIFTMSGGKISENKVAGLSAFGGGVAVRGNGSNSGKFTMNGGTISENEAKGTGSVSPQGGGVAVYGSSVVSGSFTMSGGSISNNTVSGVSGVSTSYGGGVSVDDNSTFTMSGSAEITGNTAGSGGGAAVLSGSITMDGGTISNNTTTSTSANAGGGGVYVASRGEFTMDGGTISGNQANAGGGGVNVADDGAFTMDGGTITGNTTIGNGGGVSITSTGTFRMITGIIYGSNEANTALRNTVGSGTGAALYAQGLAEVGNFDANGDWEYYDYFAIDPSLDGILDSVTENTIEALNGVRLQ